MTAEILWKHNEVAGGGLGEFATLRKYQMQKAQEEVAPSPTDQQYQNY